MRFVGLDDMMPEVSGSSCRAADFFALAAGLWAGLFRPIRPRFFGSSACSPKGPPDPTGRLRTTPGFAMVAAMTPGSVLSFAAPSGINLLALKDKRFRVGAALLEGSGECAPCSRMAETFGPGGYNAVRGHGGITARVIEGATIYIGDAVERAD
jgi:hypothetical protein